MIAKTNSIPSTATFQATDVREQAAFKQVSDFGANYFNPLIGDNAAETCGNISNAMQFLYEVMRSTDVARHEAQNGMALFIQTIWNAAQYEGMASVPAQAASVVDNCH